MPATLTLRRTAEALSPLKNAVGLVLAFYAVLSYTVGFPRLHRNSLLVLALGLPAAAVLCFWPVLLPRRCPAFLRERAARRVTWTAGLAAGALSLTLVLGDSVFRVNGLFYLAQSGRSLWKGLLMAVGFFFLFFVLLRGLFLALNRRDALPPARPAPRWTEAVGKYFPAEWLLIFLCWLPCWLAYYPGILSYDMGGQVPQALNLWDVTMYHPPAHTYFVRFCFAVGSLFGGSQAQLAAYSLIQMAVMAALFAAAVRMLRRLGISPGWRLAALLWFALFPLNALLSFVPTKDVLFTGLFLLLTLTMADMLRGPAAFFRSRLRPAALCVLLALCSLFRNNAAYAFVLVFILLPALWKSRRRALLAVGAGFAALTVLVLAAVYPLLGVKGGSARELFSVPMQQVARVVKEHGDELSARERGVINEFLPVDKLPELYNPRFADIVKNHFRTDVFLEHPARYARLWARLFFRYPGVYLDAFLSLNLGYWYPDTVQPDEYNGRAYLETNVYRLDEFPITRESRLPGLYAWYERIASDESPQSVPGLDLLFSLGLPVWLLVLCAARLAAAGRRRESAAFLPALAVWLTFMAGPVSNLRYIYFAIAAYPVFLALSLSRPPQAAAPLGKR